MKRGPAKVQVHIYDDCDVDCEAVNVSKESGDEIEWHSTGEPFTVSFESSPFAKREFHVPAKGCASSGPVVDDALYVTYHYEISRVRSGGGEMAADPDVNVKH
ncbi:MAG: hypothetical protein ACRD20_19080 [Terriglobales bacterium]